MSLGRNDIPAQLLEDIKNHLDITWDDDATDRKLRGIIAAGMTYLDRKAGGEQDYEADGTPRSLLVEYCRYGRDNALDVFENNYRALILAMQHDRAVEDYALEEA